MNLRWKIAQWFELRWWENYLRGKNSEEYLTWKKNYWKNVLSKISEVLSIDSSKTICDLGCGPAGIFIVLPDNEITATDPLIEAYQRRTSFLTGSNYPKTTFIQCTIERFSPPRKFDLVFCMNVINHVQNIEEGFDKLKEVCSNGGAIILSIDAHNFSMFKYLFRLLPIDILHPHQYDLNEYQLFLEKRGTKVLKTELLKKGFFFSHYLIIAQNQSLLF